ncbi:hypothetical protein ACIO52_20375 [Nocardia sp. NPDC087230]|uniref:hypothetical protein n=1 Tax=Nocardia sp. NPDC087230 TaxID=3364331 RepID=UPI00380D9340
MRIRVFSDGRDGDAGCVARHDVSPRYVGVLATFEPMHQVYTAVRAIPFFDADLGAGPAHGFWMTLLGLAVGLTLGALVSRLYDRAGLHRKPPGTLPIPRPVSPHSGDCTRS